MSCGITSANNIQSDAADENKQNPVSKIVGCSDIKLTNGTGFFEVFKDDNNIWWFVTPDGYAFYSIGLNCVTPEARPEYTKSVMEKYNSYAKWADGIIWRYQNWSYNTLGAWCKYDLFNNLPYTYQIKTFGDPQFLTARKLPDVWDPMWREMVRKKIENTTERFREDPYLIGYWLDNEINWGPDIFDKNTILEEFISAKCESSDDGKYHAVNFLRNRYEDNIKEFNRVWNMHLENFDELYYVTDLGRNGWIAQHSPFNKKLREDIQAFDQYFAETYFNYTTSLIRENDPNHLILGVRFHTWGTPREVIEMCGKYCDVVSVNYYRFNGWVKYEMIKYIQCGLYGCVPLDNWMERYYRLSGGKPLIVGEFGFAALDSGQRRPMGAAKLLLAQKDRADYFEWYARNCLRTSYVVGYHWFSFVDKIKKDVDTNVGVVNIYDKEYNLLVNRMAEVNKQAYEIHSRGCLFN